MRRGDRLGALRSVTTGPGAHETRTDRIHRRGVRGLGALAVLTVVVLALGLASSARAASPGEISGKVTAAVGGGAISGIEVCAYSTSEELGPEGFGCNETNTEGKYEIIGLAEGKYYVEFFSEAEIGTSYVTRYYDETSLYKEAKAVSVTSGEVAEEINAKLEVAGRIKGKVTDATTGAALKGILVCAESTSSHEVGGCGVSETSGEYAISGLAEGSYKVEFLDGHEYIAQFYDNKGSLSEAEPISVRKDENTDDINAAMQPVSTAPVNTKAPVVSGTAAVDATLSCAPGLWTGKPTPTYSYQWLRNGAPITGASSSSYAVQTADAGQSVSCQVTAHNSAGEKTATSAGVAIPALPVVTSPPTTPSATHPTVKILSVAFVASKKSVTVRIQCSQAACRGSIKLTMQIVVQRRKGKSKKNVTRKQTVTLATGAYSLAVNKSATVSLRLTATGKSKLAQAKRHALSVKITCSVQGGAAAVKAARLK